MGRLEPTHSIRADLNASVIAFSIGGYWTTGAMKTFLGDLGTAATPLLKRREPFSALGDLTDFVPQDRATAAAIRDSLLAAQKNGLRRFAVVNPAPLVKMQYRRIAEGVEVAFFESMTEAKNWLREAGANRAAAPTGS